MIPAILTGLLLSSMAAADNARKGRTPQKMLALITLFIVIMAAIFKFVPAESF